MNKRPTPNPRVTEARPLTREELLRVMDEFPALRNVGLKPKPRQKSVFALNDVDVKLPNTAKHPTVSANKTITAPTEVPA